MGYTFEKMKLQIKQNNKKYELWEFDIYKKVKSQLVVFRFVDNLRNVRICFGIACELCTIN